MKIQIIAYVYLLILASIVVFIHSQQVFAEHIHLGREKSMQATTKHLKVFFLHSSRAKLNLGKPLINKSIWGVVMDWGIAFNTYQVKKQQMAKRAKNISNRFFISNYLYYFNSITCLFSYFLIPKITTHFKTNNNRYNNRLLSRVSYFYIARIHKNQ